MKKALTIFLVLLLGGGVLLGVNFWQKTKEYKQKISEIRIGDISLPKGMSGIFVGSEDAVLVSATVRVTVNDGVIRDVDLLEHKNGRGAPAEVITKKIVEAQSLQVDVVSGATSSSKVILKAVENALLSARLLQ